MLQEEQIFTTVNFQIPINIHLFKIKKNDKLCAHFYPVCIATYHNVAQGKMQLFFIISYNISDYILQKYYTDYFLQATEGGLIF